MEGNGDLFAEGRPSADLRVAADMASIGQEYHGKRVSRKNLEAAWGVFGERLFVPHTVTYLVLIAL